MATPSLKRNAFALLTMQAINYLVPLITLPYLTRTLGAHQYGALNLAISLIQYGILFVTFGFNLSATQYIARHRDSPLLISRAFWETITAKLLLLGIAVVVLISLTYSVESFYEIRWVIFVLFLQLVAVAIDPLWFFQGIEKLEKVSLIGSAIRVLNIPLLFWLVHSPDDVVIAAGIQALIILLIALVNLYLVKKENLIKCIKYSQLKIKKALKRSLPLFIGMAAISLYNTSTPIILGLVNSYEEVGIYSASFRIQIAAIGVFTVLGQVIYPRANHLFATDTKAGYLFIKKLMLYMLPILLLATILFYLIAPKLAPWLLGEQFKNSATTLKIMAPMLLLTPYCIVFANNILLPLGYIRIYYITPLIIGCIHIIYSYILSKKLGATGAAYSILIAEILSFTILLYCVLKLTDFLKYIKKG